MMHERERKRASVSTINGKRRVRSLPGWLWSRTRGPSLRAMMRKPLLDLMQPLAAGRQLAVLVGRHGAMNLAGRGTLQHADFNRLSNGDCNFTDLRRAFFASRAGRGASLPLRTRARRR